MDRAIALRLLTAMMLLVLYPKAKGQLVSEHSFPAENLPPLCASQLALANRACSLLPYKTVPPPSPPSPPLPPPLDSHHHHRHHHHHHHRHQQSHVERTCCRWLREVDEVCACRMLVHLAPFLSRPAHNYTVFVDETCQVTFSCPSRVMAL